MCGRFALYDDPRQVAESFGYPLASGATFPPARYNIPPGGPIVAIAATEGDPEVTTLQWSFKPRWAPEDAPRTHVAGPRAWPRAGSGKALSLATAASCQ